MNEKQTHIYILLKQFSSRVADRIEIGGPAIDFRIGSASTYGLAGTVVVYIVVVLLLAQGYSLHFFNGLGNTLSLVLMTCCGLGAIALFSVSARIDLQNRMVYRYVLGFPIQKMAFEDLKAIHANGQYIFKYPTGVVFRLENKKGQMLNLLTFREKEHIDLFRELLPEVFKVF